MLPEGKATNSACQAAVHFLKSSRSPGMAQLPPGPFRDQHRPELWILGPVCHARPVPGPGWWILQSQTGVPSDKTVCSTDQGPRAEKPHLETNSDTASRMQADISLQLWGRPGTVPA